MKRYQASIATPFAHLGLRVIDNRLAAIDFISATQEIEPDDAFSADVRERIRQFLDDPLAHKRLAIPCLLTGTPFQRSVWKALNRIPVGSVVTYGEMARRLGTSARAIGNACRSNPIPVVVPCHRVVSAAGAGGYAGDTGGDMIRFKTWLLQHEGVVLD